MKQCRGTTSPIEPKSHALFRSFLFIAIQIITVCTRASADVVAYDQLLQDQNSIEDKAISAMNTLPADTTVHLEGDTIQFLGDIGYVAVYDVEKIINEARTRVRNVQIESPGGNLSAALILAQIIRHHSLNTESKMLCASACTLVFQSGVHRIASPQTVFMYHQAYLPAIETAGDGPKDCHKMFDNDFTGFQRFYVPVLGIRCAVDATGTFAFTISLISLGVPRDFAYWLEDGSGRDGAKFFFAKRLLGHNIVTDLAN
jgi:hypothetical protein